jgi:50S ribosomal protein L16 3-hydroxylase
MKSSPLKPFPNLLGGMSAECFLKDYWQKQPLLIRAAIPGFGSALSRQDLIELSCREDLESRLVSRKGATWQLDHGPFTKTQVNRCIQPWSLLVQGVNLALPEGDELLRAFSFIPYARLDDLMVSYATDGAGVGPHFDSYDVFLLQGSGQRRWRIGNPTEHLLDPDQPLRILKNFVAQEEYVLEAGDMLYLPPQWAHDGVAVSPETGDCMTWSIGFRAPAAQELGEQFLSFLQENLQLDGRYQDPELRSQNHPAEISDAMVDQVMTMLSGIRWSKATVEKFLGQYLTEPKNHIFFDAPDAPITIAKFRAQLKRTGIALDRKTQLLFSNDSFFLNGEVEDVAATERVAVRELADRRQLEATLEISPALASLLYDWYRCGFVHFQVGR